ncbi:hypothetical protein C8F04DRAFT_1236469 [Mycena alexandri]|uniref:Uncharacterized protein n=1 Tax=Mycena alexandri TaxID=1745969 RepID=A0AAD6SP13_9AGAR|nr:hypothetical protein C8F04DRAFT_1236469 [Mycena alexandri]
MSPRISPTRHPLPSDCDIQTYASQSAALRSPRFASSMVIPDLPSRITPGTSKLSISTFKVSLPTSNSFTQDLSGHSRPCNTLKTLQGFNPVDEDDQVGRRTRRTFEYLNFQACKLQTTFGEGRGEFLSSATLPPRLLCPQTRGSSGHRSDTWTFPRPPFRYAVVIVVPYILLYSYSMPGATECYGVWVVHGATYLPSSHLICAPVMLSFVTPCTLPPSAQSIIFDFWLIFSYSSSPATIKAFVIVSQIRTCALNVDGDGGYALIGVLLHLDGKLSEVKCIRTDRQLTILMYHSTSLDDNCGVLVSIKHSRWATCESELKIQRNGGDSIWYGAITNVPLRGGDNVANVSGDSALTTR